MGLNTVLTQDQLQLTNENTFVSQIMYRLDILASFFNMCFRVLENLKPMMDKSRGIFTLIVKPQLASICVRVFGIGIAVPNSPNNNSVISITGLNSLDNKINSLKTKSMECINLVL